MTYMCPHPGQRNKRSSRSCPQCCRRRSRASPAATHWTCCAEECSSARLGANGFSRRHPLVSAPPESRAACRTARRVSSSIRSPRVEPERSGLVSLNAHYHLRIPFSLDHVHHIVRPVWVVVTRVGRQVRELERPFPTRICGSGAPQSELERPAGGAPHAELSGNPGPCLSG
jgi:hypothetical protein